MLVGYGGCKCWINGGCSLISSSNRFCSDLTFKSYNIFFWISITLILFNYDVSKLRGYCQATIKIQGYLHVYARSPSPKLPYLGKVTGNVTPLSRELVIICLKRNTPFPGLSQEDLPITNASKITLFPEEMGTRRMRPLNILVGEGELLSHLSIKVIIFYAVTQCICNSKKCNYIEINLNAKMSASHLALICNNNKDPARDVCIYLFLDCWWTFMKTSYKQNVLRYMYLNQTLAPEVCYDLKTIRIHT